MAKRLSDAKIDKGALHRETGTPAGQKIGVKKLEQLKKSGTPKEKKQANWALNINKGK